MTILIIGGAAQGKSAFARTLSPEQDIIDDLHVRVQRALRDNTALPQAADFAAKPWFAKKSAAVSSRWTRRNAHGASAPADCAVTLRRRQTACIACTAASPRVSRGHHDDSSGRIFRLFTRLRAR